MKFAILGPVEVWARERRLVLGGPRQLGLLAFLVLHANRAVSSDSLIDGVWERAGAGAEKRLQMAIARLRKELEPSGEDRHQRLRTVSGGYLLSVEPGELDADVFRVGVRDGRAALDAGDPARASELLQEALALWRGPALADVSFKDFAQAEIRLLEELRLEALESRIEADLQLGRHTASIAELEALLVEQPTRERVAGHLMLALYRSGRQAEALAVYQRARAQLAEQLGLEPGPALKMLQSQILEQSPALELAAGDQCDWPLTARQATLVAPVGTVALLFTDIEGSTRLASELGASWPAVLADHHAVVAGAVAEEGGFVDTIEGDGFFVTFGDAQAAARAAVTALRGLRSHSWPAAVGELRVRMGLHVGVVERAATGYVGLEVHRAARVAAAAHGGQLLMTGAARALVGDEIASEPLGAHRLKDFPAAELLFCAVVDGRGASFFPPPRTQPVRPTNLPAGLPPLVGREAEIERVRDAFLAEQERLVTLTGRGGAGKTSLALTVASGLLDEHPGGVWLTRLATVTDPNAVLPAVAAAVGAEGELDDSPLDAIAARLCDRGPTLIVLDNLEHLLAASAAIGQLLERAPEVRVLVTSQAPLRVTGELCLAVDALDDDSARVLIEWVARRRSASFHLADDERPAISEIVSMLDGLPLALELAAARLVILTPVELRDRLRRSIDVLRDDMRDRTDRHRSLRATVDWTLSLLDQPARRLFVRMGAFAGPVELRQLEPIAGTDGLDVVESLSGLIDIALVRRVEAGDGRVRFGLPEALRQIAAAMLDGLPDGGRWRHQHAEYQNQIQWAARNCCAPAPVWGAAIEGEAEAMAALQWARAIGDPLAAPLGAARAMLLAHDGRDREAAMVLQPLLDSPPDDPDVHGQAQLANAMLLGNLDRLAEAIDAAGNAADLFTEAEGRATAVAVRGIANLVAGNLDAGLSDHELSTALAREAGPVVVSEALFLEAQARMQLGQLDLAADLLDHALEFGTLGDSPHLWIRHTYEGDLAVLRGRPRDALQHYAVSLELAQQHSNYNQIWSDLCSLAAALAMHGDDIQAFEVSGIAEAQILDVAGWLQPPW